MYLRFWSAPKLHSLFELFWFVKYNLCLFFGEFIPLWFFVALVMRILHSLRQPAWFTSIIFNTFLDIASITNHSSRFLPQRCIGYLWAVFFEKSIPPSGCCSIFRKILGSKTSSLPNLFYIDRPDFVCFGIMVSFCRNSKFLHADFLSALKIWSK
jgi:hypothetical protein